MPETGELVRLSEENENDMDAGELGTDWLS
jgi:hypothetical protein